MHFKTLLVIGLLLAPLVACGDDGSSQTPTPPDAEPEPMPDPEPQPDPEPTPTPDPMPEIMDRPSGTFEERSADVLGCLETALGDTLATGAVVGVMEDGAVVWRGAYGNKGAGIDEPVGEETLFRFGSILKMMTATAALSLSDEGKLDFDADISDVIPELVFDNLPEGGLTPHLLLSHQGGMIDELTFNGPTDDAALSGFLTSAEFLDIPFHVSPGTFYNYSNPNFMLSGLLIEALGEGSYREEMSARVFAPLGMDRTVFVAEDVLADGDYARGTSIDFFGDTNAIEPGDWENTWARPAGLGWTSIDDLLGFGRFLMMGDENVLSDASWQMLRSGQVSTLSLGSLESYGYGVIVQGGIFTGSVFRRTPLLLHDGSTGDFTSLLITMPETGFAVAVMANGPLGPLAGCVTPAILREAERHPPALTPEGLGPDASTFADYVGDYVEGAENIGPFTIELSENGGLLMTIPSLDAQNFEYTKALVPTTRDNFVLETVNGGLPWTGIRGEDGQIIHLRSRISVGVKQDGQDKRLLAVDPVRVRRAIEAIGAARPLDAMRGILRP